MNYKKTLLSILIGLSATSAMASFEKGLYGKEVISYKDSSEDFKTTQSHLNGFLTYHQNRKSLYKIDIGTRSYIENGTDDYKYDVYVDQLFYAFKENDNADLTIGRFLNPVGFYGSSPFDYSKHPFEIRKNIITSVDGAKVNYYGKADKEYYYDINVFAGTSLDVGHVDDRELDQDTQLSYGANLKFANSVGSFNLGFYASNNGKEFKVSDVSISESRSYLYQSNFGYEYSRNSIYAMAEYNRYDLKFENESSSRVKEDLNFQIAYKVGSMMPMLGFTQEKNNNFFNSGSETKDFTSMSTGFRYTFNKNSSLLGKYEYRMYDNADIDSDNLLSLGITLNY